MGLALRFLTWQDFPLGVCEQKQATGLEMMSLCEAGPKHADSFFNRWSFPWWVLCICYDSLLWASFITAVWSIPQRAVHVFHTPQIIIKFVYRASCAHNGKYRVPDKCYQYNYNSIIYFSPLYFVSKWTTLISILKVYSPILLWLTKSAQAG